MGEPRPLHKTRQQGVAGDIGAQGWSCRDEFLPPGVIDGLRDDALRLAANDEFLAAAVGSGEGRAVRAEIRGDETRWLDGAISHPTGILLGRLEELRRDLNAQLQLGLFDLELHFARYRAGAAYARHVDRFAGGSRRVLSLVLYLNAEWRREDGGALRLHPGGGEPVIDMLPQAGRLVVFLSDRFEHEVLVTARERFSVTGWFLSRAS
jgi:SM-20-related protein